MFLFACLCVPSFILSDVNRGNFNDPVDPGVESTTESAQTLSPRCYAQVWSLGLWTGGPWWAACPYQGLRSICGVQPLPDQSHKGPRGICNSTLLPCPPLFQTLLCLPCGGGVVFLLYLRVCFLVFALICLHLSPCQSLCKFYLALKSVAESMSPPPAPPT